MSESTSTAVATRPHYAGIGMTVFGGGSSLPAITSLEEVVTIAQLMARSDVAVPKHLRENPGACLAVTLQAMDWGANPFAVANKSYSVNDRLAYESQMLAAVILKFVAMRGAPKYEYTGEGGDRICKVTITMPDGEAVEWTSPKFDKITPKNSPLWKSDPDQQQGYYSMRGWARRHRPDVILGIYDREEMAAEPIDVLPKGAGIADRLPAPTSASGGFNAEKIEAAAPETPKSRARKPKPEPAPEPEAEVSDVLEGDDIPEHLHKLAGGMPVTVPDSYERVDPETGEVIEDLPQDAVPIAEEPSDTKGSVIAASGGSREASHGSQDTGSSTSDGLESPASSAEEASSLYPEPGEVYHLVGDGWDEEDRRDTYKDGKPFSTAGKAKGLAIYEDHAPEVDDPQQSALSAESGAVNQLSNLSQKPSDASTTVNTAEPDGGVTSASPSDAPKIDEPFATYIENVEAATEWAQFLAAMRVFYATDSFKALGDDRQNHIRARTWESVLEMGNAGGDRVDPGDDISAYRLMIEWSEDIEAIEGTFGLLQRSEGFKKAPSGAQANLQLATKRRIAKLRGE